MKKWLRVTHARREKLEQERGTYRRMNSCEERNSRDRETARGCLRKREREREREQERERELDRQREKIIEKDRFRKREQRNERHSEKS